MEATLRALGEILLQALPTFFLVLLLHFFLKAFFFKPLHRILHERREATEGARAQANASLKRAEEKAAAYEEALRSARNDLYREQEEQRRKWREEQNTQIQAARASAGEMIQQAKSEIVTDAAQAKQTLEAESKALAAQITRAVLSGGSR